LCFQGYAPACYKYFHNIQKNKRCGIRTSFVNGCHNMMRKLYLPLLPLLISLPAFCQLDLKNSLKDLKTQFQRSNNDQERANLALTISSFYLTNKGHNKAMFDSSRRYMSAAERLSNSNYYTNGLNEAMLIRARILLLNDNFAEVNKMAAKSSGTLYCNLHFLLGKYFLEKPNEEKADLDLADANFLMAQQYADKRHMPNISLINRVYRYNVMLERGTDAKICDKYFNNVIALCRAYHNAGIEAQAWLAKGILELIHYNSTTSIYKTEDVARLARDTPLVIYCLKEIADYNLRQGKLDTAQAQLNTVAKMYSAIGYKNLQFTYDLLTATAIAKGNIETAMRYGLTAVKYAEQTDTDEGLSGMYYKLAGLCRDLGLKQQSLQWYQKSQKIAMEYEYGFPYTNFRAVAKELIPNGKAREVLNTLDSAGKTSKINPTRNYLEAMLRGDCYLALGKLDSAEFYYLKDVKNLEARGIKDAHYYQTYQNLAGFYIQQKAFAKALPYVENLLSEGKVYIRATDVASAHLYKFKIDSARGNYREAIDHFEASKLITDSIFNQVKIKQTEQLQLQYATAERDHENLTLRNRNTLQRSELEKESLQRKIISVGLIGAVLVTGLMTYLYIAKQKNNNALKNTQKEINQQNNQLNHLLHEKEWLMKEIHHRVKNNLQIISSLLNTQSSFLDNEQAITAIRDSQNRMQAISIVHQKLYQSEDLATINLKIYIEELTHSICDSFQSHSNIRFVFDVTEANLTTAVTVPLGLILNEAITNCVKYACAEERNCVVTISLEAIENGWYQLTIRDNGKGLPSDFDIDACTSLGMNLMVGLTEQLLGRFEIGSDAGTIITIAFPPLTETR